MKTRSSKKNMEFVTSSKNLTIQRSSLMNQQSVLLRHRMPLSNNMNNNNIRGINNNISGINNNISGINVDTNKVSTKNKYISEVCALSYIASLKIKGSSIDKKKVAEIHSLVSSYLHNTINLPQPKPITINIKDINDLTIFLFSQYIDMKHDTKKINVDGLSTFNDFLQTLISPCLNKLNNNKNTVNEIITQVKLKYINIFSKNFGDLKTDFEDKYYKEFIFVNYNLTQTVINSRSPRNKNEPIVFDQSNTNEARILASNYQIVLPIPSLADAGIFTNKECHFWKDLRYYISENSQKAKGYRDNFNSRVNEYLNTINKGQKIKKTESENFINQWIENNYHLTHGVNDAFKQFLIKEKIRIGEYKLPPGQSSPVIYINPRRVVPYFEKFDFTIKYRDLTIMKATYNTNDMSKLQDFETHIRKKDLKTQIGSLRNLFTHGMYKVEINDIESSIKPIKQAYAGINTFNPLTRYHRLLEKHLGDIGPQIWALAHNTYYCTGDRSAVCQYFVLASLFNNNTNKPTKGAFFETNDHLYYVKKNKMAFLTKRNSVNKTQFNTIMRLVKNRNTMNMNNIVRTVRLTLASPRSIS